MSRSNHLSTYASRYKDGDQHCERSRLLPLERPHFIEPILSGLSMKRLFGQCRQSLAGRSLLVDFLAICFGIGAWIAINGMFVQLPLLVQTQPEGWNLPSYLTVIIQIANIGPILYSIFRGKVRDSFVIYGVLIVGTLALLLMAFFYQETTIIAGKETSTALFVLVFFIALVGCTSSVLFMPYMINYRDIYLVSYFVGEGLSGFIPSVVALGQGVGGNPTCVNETSTDGNSTLVPYTPPPNFSTQVFFFFLFGVLTLSTLAFFLLNNLSKCKNERVSRSSRKISKINNKNDNIILHGEKLKELKESEENKFQEDTISVASIDAAISVRSFDMAVLPLPKPDIKMPPLTRSMTFYLLGIEAWVCFLGNGVFPSIQSYSCLPYGNVVYHLSATLGSMANPLACIIGFFLPISSILKISVLTSLTTAVSGYIMATALLSPEPPLVNTSAGEILVVLAWIFNTGFISYVKLSVASLFRREAGRALFWCGAVQQMGSAVGAIIMFFLVNYTYLFTAYYPCQ